MAHFAELESKIDPTGFTSDIHKIVVKVTVVGNDISANGGILENNDMHIDGELWCKNFFQKPNAEFKQSSLSSNDQDAKGCGIINLSLAVSYL